MKYIFYKLFFALIFLSSNSINNTLLAKSDSTDVLIVKKCKDFEVSGDGNSDSWKSTEWIKISQRTTAPTSYFTNAKVLYSETGIYFLFDCEDKKLTSTMKADNLNLYEEDVVEIFLWPDESFPVYFEYELSPLNYELPIIVPNNKGRFLGWLPWNYEGNRKTRHATTVRGGKKESGASVSGWMAEFFIPYELLKPLGPVPPKSGTKWRANMYRIDYDSDHLGFSWQKTGKSYHEYEKFGTFIFE